LRWMIPMTLLSLRQWWKYSSSQLRYILANDSSIVAAILRCVVVNRVAL
jgi:hypothetical protein